MLPFRSLTKLRSRSTTPTSVADTTDADVLLLAVQLRSLTSSTLSSSKVCILFYSRETNPQPIASPSTSERESPLLINFHYLRGLGINKGQIVKNLFQTLGLWAIIANWWPTLQLHEVNWFQPYNYNLTIMKWNEFEVKWNVLLSWNELYLLKWVDFQQFQIYEMSCIISILITLYLLLLIDFVIM